LHDLLISGASSTPLGVNGKVVDVEADMEVDEVREDPYVSISGVGALVSPDEHQFELFLKKVRAESFHRVKY
jgi:hypothetical protein